MGSRLNPFDVFKKWYMRAVRLEKTPRAMILATVGKNNHPSARTVLLNEFSEDGFFFSTDYRSQKANEIKRNAYAAIVFYWPQLGRQVRIEGKVKRATAEISDMQFKSFSRHYQLKAWVSFQSHPLHSMRQLISQLQIKKQQFKNQAVPRPQHWGSYCLIPNTFEFYSKRKNKLHERKKWKKDKNSWRVQQLSS